jgi:hypothetical protein
VKKLTVEQALTLIGKALVYGAKDDIYMGMEWKHGRFYATAEIGGDQITTADGSTMQDAIISLANTVKPVTRHEFQGEGA